MSHQTFSIDFIVRKVKDEPDLAYIFARVTINGKIREISIKETIEFSRWDNKSEKVKGKTQETYNLNNAIDNARNKIRNIYRELSDRFTYVTAQQVKDIYTGAKNKDHTLLKLFDRWTEKFDPHLAPGTMKNYSATRQYIEKFVLHEFKEQDIHVKMLDYPFISDLENYIPAHPIKVHDPCTGNGVAKHLERLKGIVIWGQKMGWLKDDPFKTFSPRRLRTRVIKLKAFQLHIIEHIKLNNEKIKYVRDLFIFSCYSGFAFSDVMKLTMEDFDISATGQFWCSIYRSKSEELEAIPMLEKAVLLIKKYKDHPRSLASGKIFPPITNQDVNRYLKILVEICDIKFNLTFHVARHTFAYVIALKNGVPIAIVKEMLGHIKITTTENYTDVDQEMLEEGMEMIEERMRNRPAPIAPTKYLEQCSTNSK